MSDHIVFYDENGSLSLAHYGVLGMKWGVRHNPQRAYEKATKKFNKLANKSDKYTDKAGKYNYKANRQRIGSTHRNAEIARRAYSKGMRYTKRASKWMKSMEKEFSKQSIVALDEELISKGKMMTERYRMTRVSGLS